VPSNVFRRLKPVCRNTKTRKEETKKTYERKKKVWEKMLTVIRKNEGNKRIGQEREGERNGEINSVRKDVNEKGSKTITERRKVVRSKS
jgi:hypothetical protein